VLFTEILFRIKNLIQKRRRDCISKSMINGIADQVGTLGGIVNLAG
jgi:hypothetical protein